MKSVRYLILAAALGFSLVMIAYAQEKGCEYEGKKYEHGDQVWSLKGDKRCWVCDDGVWAQSVRQMEAYCKGKF